MSKRIVALVPAFNEAEEIGATVQALLSGGTATEVVVVDDNSSDSTAAAAEAAGARVIRSPRNLGKGGAVNRAVSERLAYDVLLLIDGDVGETATEAAKLAAPVINGQTDMAIAVLPSKAGTGGFGLALGLARFLIRARGGFRAEAPLSGQRALNKAAVESAFPFARDYGMETAMSIDVLRDGLRVLEVPADFAHSYTYRDVSGFLHRGKQFMNILKVAFRWPRAKNFQGKKIPSAVGAAIPLVFALVMIASLAILTLVNGTDAIAVLTNQTEIGRVVAAWIIVVLVAGLAGFVDDMFGSAQARGFKGHIKSLFKGRVTTGLIKAVLGGLAALVAAIWIHPELSPSRIIVDSLIIAFSINLINLLDLRPGRALKTVFIIMGLLAVFTYFDYNAGGYANIFWFLPAAGAVLLTSFVIFPYDLRAKIMLGDSGSNVLGGVVGLGFAVTLLNPKYDIYKLLILLILIILNIISEKWSFTRIIERVKPLKWFDELGRI